MKELSKKNDYYISKDRQLELEHYCRQYPKLWAQILHLRYNPTKQPQTDPVLYSREWSDKVGDTAVELTRLTDRVTPIQRAADMIDEEMKSVVLEHVFTGKSYDAMNAKFPMPISRHEFYTEVRKFYYILSELRN